MNLRRILLALLALLTLLAVPTLAVAQPSTTYFSLTLNPTVVPAGSNGATLVLDVTVNYGTPSNYNVCFFTGYGASATPITPTSTVLLPGGYNYYQPVYESTFNIPASSIQNIPPSAFSAGNIPSFAALVYAAAPTRTSCSNQASSGNSTSASTNPVIQYPSISALSPASVFQRNPNLTSFLPPALTVTGANFLSSTTGSTPTTVNFASGQTNYPGQATALYANSLRTTIPGNLPATATSAVVTVCNTGSTFTYCSNAVTLPLLAHAADPGTLSAAPGPAASGQAVTLTAMFGGPPSVAGVPSGTVTFLDGTNPVGSAPLVLNPDAALVPAANPPTFSTGSNTVTSSLRFAADFNADGLKDLLFIDNGPSSPKLHFLLGANPNGSFAADAPYTLSNNYPCITVLSAAVADFNGDGFPDVALLCNNNTAGYALYAILNNGDGTFNAIPRTYTASSVLAPNIVSGDFNGDGKQDLVLVGTVNFNAGTGFQTLLGVGDGTFTAGPVATGLATQPDANFGDYQVIAADMNADGLTDIAVLNGTSPATGLKNQVQIFRNTGGGNFVYSSLVQTDGTAFNAFAVRPMTLGNAYPDLIVIGSSSSNIPGLSVHLNSKTAAIAFSDTGYLSSVTGTNLQQAVFGDFNADGKLDAAVYDGVNTKIYAGDGTLFFAPYFSGLTASTRGSSLIAAPDLNADGYSDLLTYSTASINSVNQATVRAFITSATAKAVSAPIVFPGGSHTLNANAPGTYTIAPGTAQTFLTVALATPNFVCGVAPNSPATYGTAVTLTCQIQSGPQGTGSVQFIDGTNPLATIPLATGSGANAATYTSTTFGAGTHFFSFRYSGDSYYAAAQPATIQYSITAATPTVTYSPAPATITYGTPLVASQFNAVGKNGSGATVPGTYTYNHAVGDILPTGINALTVTFSPTDTADYFTSTAQASVLVTKQTPTLTYPTPAPITQGTPLTSSQLNAVATDVNGRTLPGTYTYNPGPGSILPVGSTTITAGFNPTDTTNYTFASASVTQVVTAPPTTTVLSALPSSAQYGQPITFSSVTNVGTSPASGTTTFSEGPILLGTSTGNPATLQISTLGAGSHVITSTFAANANYAGSSSATRVTVVPATVTIAWAPNPSTITYGTPLSDAQLNASATNPYNTSIPGNFVYSPAAGTILGAGTRTLSVTFTPTNPANFTSATGTVNITVARATPVLTYPTPASISQGTPLSATQLNATAADSTGAALPGTFTYSPASGTVLPVGTTPITATFTPTDTANFNSATATVNQVVNPSNTTTTLSAAPSPSQFGQTVTLTAMTTATGSTASGTVNFYEGETLLGTSTTNPATLQISTFNAGTHNLTALFRANANFAGSSANTSLTVLPATVTLAWSPNPATIVFGTPLSAAQLNASASTPFTASVPGTIVYSPAAGAILRAGPQTLSATFTPTDTANFNPATRTVNITVARATPILTYPTPAAIMQGTALSAAQLNATAADATGAALPGTFTYSPAAGTVPPVGTTPITATFTPTDATDFNAATATVNQVVTASNTTTTLSAAPSPSQFGQAVTLTATTSATGSSASPSGTINFYEGTNLLGTSTTNPATLQISTLNAGVHNLTATFLANANFAGSSANTSLTVLSATVTLAWSPNPATIVYGTPLSAAQLNASASTQYMATVPGTIAYSPAAGAILRAGPQTLSATFTPTDTANFTSATRTVNVTVTRATPILTYPTPASIPQGTALSATQLNATAADAAGTALPGTFTYSPAAGTVPPVGTTPITVTFTPTDALDFTSATATVNQVVTASNTATTLVANPSSTQYGQAVTFTATSVVTGTSTAATGTTNFYDGTTLIGTSTSSPATLVLSTLTAGTHNLTAGLVSSTNFAASTSPVLAFVVASASPTLAFAPTVPTIVYGTPLTAAQLNASVSTPYASSVPGTIVYSPAAGSILTAGAQTITATFTPTDTANFTPATRTATITVTRATPTVTWPAPSPITAGTALSAAQLNASATGVNGQPLPGTFTYTPPAGTVLNTVGTTTLNLLYTPTDTVDYVSVPLSVPLTVTAARSSVALTSSANPVTYGQPLTLTATVTSPLPASPTGAVTFYNGTVVLGTAPLTGGVATLPVASLTANTYNLTATYAGDTQNGTATTTTPLRQVVSPASATTTFVPSPASIVYGTALSAAQLDATSSIPGAFTYTPAAGTILTAGQQTLSATFTPTDTVNYKTVTLTATITVTQAVPTIVWATPASVIVGSTLSATQLNATATFNGQPLPGTFTYTPPAGTVVTASTTTLATVFTPTDRVDFTSAQATVNLTVVPVTLTSLSSSSATFGDPAKTITLTGTGFIPSAIVQVNGSPVVTSFVNSTTLTAVIPASKLLLVGVLQISVVESALNQTTASLPFTVNASQVPVTLTTPPSITPGTQLTLAFQLATPYPVDLTVTLTLGFTPANGLPDDPTVQFPNGTRTYTFVVPANSTTFPPVPISTGTVAGTISATVRLSAGGVDVTPTSLQAPRIIQAPVAVPGLASATIQRDGEVLTVTVRGFSNTREVTGARFHFNAADGFTLDTHDITIDVTSIFAAWFNNPTSTQYGSTFTYTQPFNLNSNAAAVGSVTVTLVNAAGTSVGATTP